MPHPFLKTAVLSLGLCASAAVSCLLAASPATPSIELKGEDATNAIPAPARIDGQTLIATVLGEPITNDTKVTTDSGLTLTGTGIIMVTLFDRYAKERNITVTDEEVAAYAARVQSNIEIRARQREASKQQLLEDLKNGKLSGQEKEDALRYIEAIDQLAEHERRRAETPIDIQTKSMMGIVRPLIQRSKTLQQLYRDYGGRVIFQQMGPEPVDAMRDFLKDEQAKGSFIFHDPESETNFWKYFTTTSQIYITDEKEVQRMMNTPWWLEAQPEEDAE